MNALRIATLCAAALCLLSCAGTAEPAGLVPPTADQDPSLPAIDLHVAGRTRRVHARSFGPEEAPVLLVMPGSVSDMRAYLPFQTLAGSMRVVMWDQRGQGLSERVERRELGFEAMVEEIKAVKELCSPGKPVALLGHSWSAVFAGLYVEAYPEDVSDLILMEPFGFRVESMRAEASGVNLMTPGYLDMNWLSDSIRPTSHELLDFRTAGMLRSGVRPFFKDPSNPPPWPIWRAGGLALLTWESALYNDKGVWDFDLSEGLEDYKGRVLLVGSQYSFIGYDFQARWNAPLFSGASELELLLVPDSGHRMITENWAALYEGIASFLGAVPAAEGVR